MNPGRLPIGIQTFRKIREGGLYYVDKTAWIERLAVEAGAWFLSRPRRFGKSLLLDTIAEAFAGSEELFRGLALHDRWDWSVRYPVLRLSFGSGNFTGRGHLASNLDYQLTRLEEGFGLKARWPDAPERLRDLLVTLHEGAGHRVVVLVDEYDKPILDAFSTPDLARANRDRLAGFYAAIKDADAHVHLAFLTGVSKFSRVSLFPSLNRLRDITFDPSWSSICGFSDEEVDTVFAPELPGLDREAIREWYDGYSWNGGSGGTTRLICCCCLPSGDSSTTGSRRALLDSCSMPSRRARFSLWISTSSRRRNRSSRRSMWRRSRRRRSWCRRGI